MEIRNFEWKIRTYFLHSGIFYAINRFKRDGIAKKRSLDLMPKLNLIFFQINMGWFNMLTNE